MSRNEQERFAKKLEPGVYTFKHPVYHNITLTIKELDGYLKNAILLEGEKEVVKDNGEKTQVVTISRHSFAKSFEQAWDGLSTRTKGLIGNFAVEREIAEGEVVHVADEREGISLRDRRIMQRTGKIPRPLRILKSEGF